MAPPGFGPLLLVCLPLLATHRYLPLPQRPVSCFAPPFVGPAGLRPSVHCLSRAFSRNPVFPYTPGNCTTSFVFVYLPLSVNAIPPLMRLCLPQPTPPANSAALPHARTCPHPSHSVVLSDPTRGSFTLSVYYHGCSFSRPTL